MMQINGLSDCAVQGVNFCKLVDEIILNNNRRKA
jgi:hypothetical protein